MKKYMNFKEVARIFGKYLIPESDCILWYEGNDQEKQAVISNENKRMILREESVQMKFWSENLPYFFLLMDEKGDVKCADLLKVYQAVIDEMVIKYENLHYYFRPDVKKGIFHQFFIWLLQIRDDFLANKLDTNDKIKQYFEILKQRGTTRSLVRLVRLIFDVDCEIKEKVDIMQEFPQLIFPYPVRKEQVFELQLSQKMDSIEELKRIIYHHKPIHTICIVSYAEKDQKKVLTVL